MVSVKKVTEGKAYTVFRGLESAVDVFGLSQNLRHTRLVITEPLPETRSEPVGNDKMNHRMKTVFTKRNSWRHESL